MNENFAFDLNVWGIATLVIIAIAAASLVFYRKTNAYLKKNYFLQGLPGTLIWVCLWYIGNDFMVWWLSAIIAIFVAFLIERLAKKNDT